MPSRRHALLIAAALSLLSLWPLQDALWTNTIPGAGPDVVSTLWGNWWAQQVGLIAAMGSETTLVNHPYGAQGSVLSPSGAISWAVGDVFLGPARAAILSAWLTIAGFALGVAWLTARCGGGGWGALVAGLVVLSSRYLFFGVGEGSPVAVAALPIPLGMAGLLAAAQGRWLGGGLAAMAMAWTAAENPYLAPALPAVGAFLLLPVLWRGDDARPLIVSLMLGAAGVMAFAGLFGRTASPDYPREVAGQIVQLLGRPWSIVDLPWARATPTDLLWPGTVRWTLSSVDAQTATGGRYLGLVGLCMSLAALRVCPRRALGWWAVAVGGMALSFGSVQNGLAGPFLFLNGFMDAVARPLTQPTRFLIFALLGMGVSAGLMVHTLVQKWGSSIALLCCALLAIDGVVFGGLSLDLPETELPDATCMASLSGGVLLWPWDGMDGEQSTAQRYQIQHQQPAPQTGIASWAISADGRAANEVRGAGWNGEQLHRLNRNKLLDLGYRWAIVDTAADPDGAALVQAALSAATPTACGDLQIYNLIEAAPDWPGPRQNPGGVPRSMERQ